MAKRTSKAKAEAAEETQEMPTATEEATAPLAPDTELQYIYNEDTGELRQVVARAGYAPVPMPFGFRLARNEEVPGK